MLNTGPRSAPADRFTPTSGPERDLLPLWLPAALAAARAGDHSAAAGDERTEPGTDSATNTAWTGGPVEFDRVVPPAGNLQLAGRQLWLGPEPFASLAARWHGRPGGNFMSASKTSSADADCLRI